MSTAIQVEKAIEALPPEEFAQLREWFEEYTANLEASESLARLYDEEEGEGGQLLDGSDG